MAMMTERLIQQTADFPAGTRLALDAAQVRSRRHCLKAVGDGFYLTTAPVQFKAGEVIGLEGEPAKAQAEAVVLKDAPAKPARKKA